MWRRRNDLQDSTAWVRKIRGAGEQNWTLEELLADVTADNLHPETNTSNTVRREVW